MLSDYGIDNPDQATIERGPKMPTPPLDSVYEPKDINGYTSIHCVVDAYPAADFGWTRERAGEVVEISPEEDPRYTMINGVLIIHDPTVNSEDDGKYQCQASNKFGNILSNVVTLNFGCECEPWRHCNTNHYIRIP